jgi:hypothetical protein
MSSSLRTVLNHEDAPNEAPSGLALIETLAAELAEVGLPLPPIPEQLGDALISLGPWLVGTRQDDAPGPYQLGWFVEEALAGRAPDYLVLGQDGHGTASWGMHYVSSCKGPWRCLSSVPGVGPIAARRRMPRRWCRRSRRSGGSTGR